MLSSINSSLSSELCSIDMSVESDSELEWVTPEMIATSNQSRQHPSNLICFMLVMINIYLQTTPTPCQAEHQSEEERSASIQGQCGAGVLGLL